MVLYSVGLLVPDQVGLMVRWDCWFLADSVGLMVPDSVVAGSCCMIQWGCCMVPNSVGLLVPDPVGLMVLIHWFLAVSESSQWQ